MSRTCLAILLAVCGSMCCGQDRSAMAQSAAAVETPAEVESPGDGHAEDTSPFDGLVFYCTRCKKEVPEQIGAGSTCPHCGAYFGSATNADGSETKVDPPQSYSMRFWGPIILLVVFGGEYAYRRWKRRSAS